MPGALLLAKDNVSSFKLEEILKAHAFRVKFTFDKELIAEWLKLITFDVVLLPLDTCIEDQERLTASLWARNPQAACLLYDLDTKSTFNEAKQRLFGTEVIHGEKALPHLERILVKISGKKPLKKDDFKIAVVEDLDSPRDIICAYIEALGYLHVKGLTSAREAIEQLRDNPEAFDCIITDERMPEMSGHELVEFARKNAATSQIPIIILTAHGTQDCLSHCLRAGATGFLVKPPKKEDLIRELARAARVASGIESARMINQQNIDQVIEAIQRKSGLI